MDHQQSEHQPYDSEEPISAFPADDSIYVRTNASSLYPASNQEQSEELIQLDAANTNIQQKQDDHDDLQAQDDQTLIVDPIPKPLDQDPPLDYWQLVIEGNFFFALTNDFFPVDQLGPKGFGVVHYLATYNDVEGLKVWHARKANLDLLSTTQQRAIQISANYGYIEVTKFLISCGCSLELKDDNGYSPLFWAIIKKRYGLMFYLATLSDLRTLVDSNGCSVVHWAAYENDAFLLRFFKAVGVSFNLFDKFGYTPLSRATQNYSFEAVRFFLESQPDMLQYPVEIKGSRYLAYACSRARMLYSLKSSKGYIAVATHFENHRLFMLLTLFSLFFLAETISFLCSEAQITLFSSYFWILNNFGYLLSLIFTYVIGLLFIMKAPNNQTQGTKLISRLVKKRQNQEQIGQEFEKQTLLQPPQRQTQLEELNELESKRQAQPKSPHLDPHMEMRMNQDTIVVTEPEKRQDQEELLEEPEKEVPIEMPKPVNIYQLDLQPKFLQGITIKDFLSINYRPVEEFIDTMVNKPPQYFKFASSIGQYKEEINQLLELNDPLWYQAFTIVHLVYYLFETNRLRAVHNIDWGRICPTCLQYKIPRMFHCKHCKECVKDFHFHSVILGKCINSTNHLSYAFFIFSLAYAVAFYLFFIFLHYYSRVHSIIVMPQQTLMLINSESGWILALIYLLNLILWPFLSIQALIEFVSITYNLTYNEMFNSARYRYLYEPVLTAGGKVYLRWKSRFPNGITRNYLYYAANQVRNMRIL